MATPAPPPSILFLPDVGDVRTSERPPTLLRLLRDRHEVVGVRFPWDRWVYDTARAKVPRYVLYAVDEALGAVRGFQLARRRRLQVTFAETPHHALVGLWIARMLGLRAVWDSHGNALLFARSVGKGPFYTSLSTRLERFLGRHVDLLITVSAKDADAYVAMGVPRTRIRIVPTPVQIAEVDRMAAAGSAAQDGGGRKVILFFGSFRYPPNAEALRFLVERLAPFLETEGIPFEIQVAGRDTPSRDLGPHVRSLGFVENLPALVRESDLCVAPIWKGVGTLTKVVDVMAAGTPIVVSRFVTTGLPEIRDRIHAQVAATEEEFCERVAYALRHPEEMEAMARNARRLVEELYDSRVLAPRLDGMIEDLVRPRGGVTA